MNFQQTTLLKSVHKSAHLPDDDGLEVALVGRSNCGKSSALNSITGQKKLARISKTPGRTQAIHFFEISEHKRLVDLPGYGFAKVPKAVREHWNVLIADYFAMRQSLAGLFLLMDIRHPLKESDWMILNWLQERHLPAHILLTKADKLKRGAMNSAVLSTEKKIKQACDQITIQAFSAHKQIGVEQAKKVLGNWLKAEA